MKAGGYDENFVSCFGCVGYALVMNVFTYEEVEYIFSGLIDFEEFMGYLHFELLRSNLSGKMKKKPFHEYLVKGNGAELENDSYRTCLRKLNVYIDEKEKDFASADKSRLSDIHKYDGTKNKRKGFPMTPIEFAQFEMADALEIEKGQSLYRFGNYKNVKNEEIIDYYKKYDKALRSKMFLSSVSPDMLLSNQKSAYAIQAINFDILEHERIMEFIARILQISLSAAQDLWLDCQYNGEAAREFTDFLNSSLDHEMDEETAQAFWREFQKKCVAAYGRSGPKDREGRVWKTRKVNNKLMELGLKYYIEKAENGVVLRAGVSKRNEEADENEG